MSQYRSIELSLGIGCPIKCFYCPQKKLLETYHGNKIMEIKNLVSIIKNSVSQDCLLEVFFSGFYEPLCVNNWKEYVSICHQNSLISKVIIFTTGYGLQPEDIVYLSKLEKITIFFHVSKNSNYLISNLPTISKYISHNTTFICVGSNESEFVDFKNTLINHNLKFAFQEIISRAGNMGSKIFVNHPVACEKTSTHKRPVIMPDGTAVVCSNDFGCKMIIGNLLSQRWEDLDFSKINQLQNVPDSNLPCFNGCHLATKQFKLFV